MADPLAETTLERLRVALAAMSGGRSSRAAQVALAGVAPPGVRLTLDLAAERTLGHAVVIAQVPRTPGADPCFASLTPREREVAALVAAGLRNRDVALALGVTVPTVKDHVHHILLKSGLDGRAQLAAVW
jgi:DNA-binding NarL/FixJ family response regulator